MLDYLTDLMEDSHDFGWQAAKGYHAIFLCKMEDNKILWDNASQIDKIRRVHEQKPPNPPIQNTKNFFTKDRPTPCKLNKNLKIPSKECSYNVSFICAQSAI